MAALQLEIKLFAAVFLRQLIAPDQRRIPLPDGEQRGLSGDGQVFFILEKNALFHLPTQSFSLSLYKRETMSFFY